MVKKIRIQKIKQKIYKSISIILQQKIKNSYKFIYTITNIIISSDLINIKIYVTILNCILNKNIKITEKQQIKKLQYYSKYIRYIIKKNLNMKFTPNLIFIYDKSYKNNLYMYSKINK
ncbi:MAG: 30S ribosome-binding factor RbfA [Enterobacteriaceae bacterium]